jgi:hypothetical protein
LQEEHEFPALALPSSFGQTLALDLQVPQLAIQVSLPKEGRRTN